MAQPARISRRVALVGTATLIARPDRAVRPETERTVTTITNLVPLACAPDGGGPWPFAEMGFDRSELDPIAKYLRELPQIASTRPSALLVVSAPWEERVPPVLAAGRPPMFYDYY